MAIVTSTPLTTPSPSKPAPVKLIVLDYDYTVHDWDATPFVADVFIEAMASYQALGGLFAINSGRTLEQMSAGLQELDHGLQPDFLLTTEREVWRPAAAPREWEEFGDWNSRCRQAHDELALASADVLEALGVEIRQLFGEAKLVRDKNALQGLIAAHPEQMAEICDLLETRLAHGDVAHLPLHYQRNDIYLRFCHREYHKGAALKELTRLLELDAEEIFVAGDNHNDLSMLRPELAQYLACPANSIEEVRAAIAAMGGFVARERCSMGVVEALAHFRVPGFERTKRSAAA